MVIEDPAFLALTRTPSIAPSSVEVTCPLNAKPGAFAAPVKSNATRKGNASAVAMTNTEKNFLSIRPPRGGILNSGLKRRRRTRLLLTLDSSRRQACVARRRQRRLGASTRRAGVLPVVGGASHSSRARLNSLNRL